VAHPQALDHVVESLAELAVLAAAGDPHGRVELAADRLLHLRREALRALFQAAPGVTEVDRGPGDGPQAREREHVGARAAEHRANEVRLAPLEAHELVLGRGPQARPGVDVADPEHGPDRQERQENEGDEHPRLALIDRSRLMRSILRAAEYSESPETSIARGPARAHWRQSDSAAAPLRAKSCRFGSCGGSLATTRVKGRPARGTKAMQGTGRSTNRAGVAVSLLACGALLATCGGAPERSAPTTTAPPTARPPAPTAAAAAPLAGTEWRLVEIQSMDDSVGSKRPLDPSLYTMRLNGDGTVNMRLDCNRANGSWSAQPSADPSNGRFEFGPLAGTRALCPPPSLDEQVTAQAQYVRSYLLKDGRLYLSLMADGGIVAWEPVPALSFETKPDPGIEAAILTASPSYTRDVVEAGGVVGRGRYVYARVDLNGDGKDEVLVYTLGSVFCGTGGCDLLLFTPSQGGYALVNDFPITRNTVVVSDHKTAGWSDLFRHEAGGGASSSYVRHVFDGKHYVEKERTKGKQAPPGRRVFDEDLAFDKGIPLEPPIRGGER
jgi:heat shock protein HslJ